MSGRAAPLGDERQIRPVESWMIGQTIVGVEDFEDEATGQRWRQIRLSNGDTVQILFTHPWLILGT